MYNFEFLPFIEAHLFREFESLVKLVVKDYNNGLDKPYNDVKDIPQKDYSLCLAFAAIRFPMCYANDQVLQAKLLLHETWKKFIRKNYKGLPPYLSHISVTAIPKILFGNSEVKPLFRKTVMDTLRVYGVVDVTTFINFDMNKIKSVKGIGPETFNRLIEFQALVKASIQFEQDYKHLFDNIEAKRKIVEKIEFYHY